MELFDPSRQVSLSPLGQELATKLKSRQAVIGVVGLGYVGLPIALEFALKGFRVWGVDVSAGKVAMLNKGENYIEDLSDDQIAKVVKDGMLKSSTDFAALKECDSIFICVPTPFNTNKDPDLSFIVNSGIETGKNLRKGQLVILKSTTFPGTTETYLIPELEKHSGLKAGKDFFVSFSPERVDPGNKTFHTGNTPIVVGGIDPESTYLTALTNHQIIEKVYQVDNPKVAELEKLLENIFRSVNIALVNELALLCERMGINVWEVIDAAGTKPFGFMKFMPGPGIGGHCIPIDPYYLSWLARAYDFETKFITLSANVNESMPYHVVNKVVKEIATQPVSLGQAKVMVIGVAFKKNVKDLRHSPAEVIMRLLRANGITHISYSDPWVPEYEVDDVKYASVELTPALLAEQNCTIIVTDHDAFDPAFIVKNSRSVVDTRNMMQHIREGREKVRLLGANG